eukprot:jgi/Astpho2/7674/gw1.00115.150.1_t
MVSCCCWCTGASWPTLAWSRS